MVLVLHGGHCTVPGQQDGGRVDGAGQEPQSAEHLHLVSAGQVGATHGSLEDDVAVERHEVGVLLVRGGGVVLDDLGLVQ